MYLYRVFPCSESASIGEPGHPLYRPPRQQFGRIDNSDKYATLYASDSASGAIAERFAPHLRWSDTLFSKFSTRVGEYMALATIEASDSLRLCDMDNAGRLLALRLRPSQVVSKRLSETQAWALATYERSEFDGISWWSYHDSRWTTIGLWNVDPTTMQTSVKRLTTKLAEVKEAADVINREIVR